ncbi:Thioredoxin-dependent 5'-adenylylsulfate reductase [Fundidesulfovibrio magnetotacticus]|uniref:Thioredoxin-dependent 5'-adenylylsulfate reductase n=1 Tax=Fundidesulfovibrio magnetotacticus TaxID=2730080 RepID=A0A6V8LSW3_9BACT|nr:phosphoadenosine phosphosulfate reductase family protein [Fundidesulfovibrio magnetotacticus]GFK95562.1 Thioredoxin-dependent 5'-adenylylsulfate reductase [Fundidesulfovibrio magnetotacticus]
MQSLQEKLAHTIDFLESLLKDRDPSCVAVAWTGGKDSTVVLNLWRAVTPGPLKAVNLDTGHKFPEILAFRDRMAREWGVDLHIVRPLPEEIPQEIAQDKMACCRALKVEPLRRAVAQMGLEVLLSGVRADENRARKNLDLLEDRNGYLQANPILHWTEMDVWALITQRGLPYCELYDRGYRSLGCVPCTALSAPGLGERGGRDSEKEARMAELHALGYF